MKIEVMMFAAAKETTGVDRVTLEIDKPVTAKSLMDQLANQFPDLKTILPSCRFAVDDQYVAGDFTITSNHEVALIPPVSGG